MQKLRNMININVDLLQWFINFLIEKASGGTVENEIIQGPKWRGLTVPKFCFSCNKEEKVVLNSVFRQYHLYNK